MTEKIIKPVLVFLLLISTVAAQSKSVLRLDLTDKPLLFGLSERIPKGLPKLGLALSGGGSRSVAQLGVLQVFEEDKVPVDIIVGTSMGSVVGGLFSAGYSLHDLDSMLLSTHWDDFFSSQQSKRKELFLDQKVTEDNAILSFRLDGFKLLFPTSISSGERSSNLLNLFAINAPIQAVDNFDGFKYKYRAVCSDLVTGKEVILDKGELGLAMRASSSVSFVLPPVKQDSLMLVDGGLVANIPATETRAIGADLVVAVNCSSPLYTLDELNYPWTIADQIVSIPMKILNTRQIETADFVIQPELNSRKNSDFSNLIETITSGYDAARRQMPGIKSELDRRIEASFGNNRKFYRNISFSSSSPSIQKTLTDFFGSRDSVSEGQLLYQLYKIQRQGIWKDLHFEIEEKEKRTFISLVVKENPFVYKYNLDGINVFNPADISAKLAPLLDKPFNPEKTEEAVLDIIRFYKKAGYSIAKVENLSFDEATNTLSLKINEGLISKISVEGNVKTKEKIITREFSMKEGDYFKYDLAEEGLTNLRSTYLFDQIELSVIEKNGLQELIIKVAEKVSNVIRFGFRVDNENLAQISLDLRDENFNGSGQEVGAIISGGTRNRSFILEQRANRVFDSYLTYKIRAFEEFEDVNVYKDDSVKSDNQFSRSKTGEYRQIFYGGIFGIGAQVKKFGNLFVEARYQRDEVKNNIDYTGPVYKMDISSLRFSLSIDSQNQYPYPTSGFLIKAFYETAQTAFGGDIGYTKFFIDYKNIFSYRNTSTWTFRAMLGVADNTLPLSEQFSLGGQNSFFGLRDNEYRGRQIFLTSLEYGYKLPVQLFFEAHLKARYDLGSVWIEREQIRLADLRHGIGATLSLNTPIGPADFSVGRSFYLKNKLAENTVVWGPTYFYFTIGFYY
jgi:NTE family protein